MGCYVRIQLQYLEGHVNPGEASLRGRGMNVYRCPLWS